MHSMLIRHMTRVSVLMLSVILMVGTTSTSPASGAVNGQQTSGTVIAYISSSTRSQAIRLVNPDGSGDTPLWQFPFATSPEDAIGTLAWRPDGGELLFDSGHDWQRSMNIRDLYAIAPNGSGYRRVSRPPAPNAYAAYATGTVTFQLAAFMMGDVQIYIEGATEPISFFARSGMTYQITQTIADFGPNVRQYIRLWNPSSVRYACDFSLEGWVDPVAGQTTNFGTVDFNWQPDFACPFAFSGTWAADGASVLYVFREMTTDLYSKNNLWQIAARANIGDQGTRLLNMYDVVYPERLYRAVIGPSSQANMMLMLHQAPVNDQVYLGTLANALGAARVNLGLCPVAVCQVLDIAWLPDGSGFYMSRTEEGIDQPPHVGVLYRYTFADQTLNKVLHLPGEVIGKLAVAPDGKAIAFERAQRLSELVEQVYFGATAQCPCEIWRVNNDGSDVRRIVADGRAPAWSMVAPQTRPEPNPQPELTPRLWLPTIRR